MSDLRGYYDKAGRPITREEFARLKYNTDGIVSDYSRIGLDQVGPGVEVSTVWLGYNHAFMHGAPPVIFETLIFGGYYDGDMRRYCTEFQARRGHRDAVNNLRRGRPPW